MHARLIRMLRKAGRTVGEYRARHPTLRREEGTGSRCVAAGPSGSERCRPPETAEAGPPCPELLEAAVDHVSDAVFVLDGNGRVIRGNPAAATLFGRLPAGSLASAWLDPWPGDPAGDTPDHVGTAHRWPARILTPAGIAVEVDATLAGSGPGLRILILKARQADPRVWPTASAATGNSSKTWSTESTRPPPTAVSSP